MNSPLMMLIRSIVLAVLVLLMFHFVFGEPLLKSLPISLLVFFAGILGGLNGRRH